ncbi:MAG: GAF domain-containing protein [Proteobacteria bacterium]|nr:GAF domain-containing protein [Pseudomonadota bacterium]
MNRSLSLLAKVLTRVGTDAPLPSVLADLALYTESVAPDTRCSILLVDPTTATLRAAAGPSLGDSFVENCDGQPIGEGFGACAAAAAYGAIVTANPKDPKCFSRCRNAAASSQFGSCWSAPIFDDDRVLLGVFSVYRAAPGEPSREQATALRIGARLAALVVVRHGEADRLRATAAALIDRSDRRRAKAAVDIHEGVAQELAAAALFLAHTVPRLHPADAVIAADLERVGTTLRTLTGRLRAFAASLAPLGPGELCLTLALDGLAVRTASQTSIEVRRRINPAVDRLVDAQTAVQLYRIAEEAVDNTVRHASAKTLTLIAAIQPESLVMEVADDGVGLAERPDALARTGIVSMSARAARIGSRLEIDSPATGGTTVRVSVPLATAGVLEVHGASRHRTKDGPRREVGSASR